MRDQRHRQLPKLSQGRTTVVAGVVLLGAALAFGAALFHFTRQTGPEREIAWQYALTGSASAVLLLTALQTVRERRTKADPPAALSVSKRPYQSTPRVPIPKGPEDVMQFTQFAIDRSPDIILWIDWHGRIIYANESATRHLGHAHGELLQLGIQDIDPGKTTEYFTYRRESLKNKRSLTYESYHLTAEGALIPVEVALTYLEYNGKEFGCCISRNIADRRRAEQNLTYQAQHDDLTGLPNRRLFESRLAMEIAGAQHSGQMLAVIFFDLDGFKLINDTLGHATGNRLLQELAERLKDCVGGSDLLARMGGDEFTLVVSGLTDESRAMQVAQCIQKALQNGFQLEGHELLVTASLGISLFPQHASTSQGLLQCADSAMYEAKRTGKNAIQVFTPTISAAARERLELENHLRRALERKEFLLYFQPQFSLETNEIVRYEALVRWNHPTLGMIPPAKFVPIAEETNLIEPIGRWVLEESLRQLKNLQLATGSSAGVAVNVSSVQFVRPDFVERVLETIRKTELDPALLELELTESVVMQGIEEVASKIQKLRNAGVTVALDDFGTGYSSLSYLQRLPIDCLKIDRSFLSAVPSSPAATSMVHALISMAHGLGMKVVAEGVETAVQLEAMQNSGCDVVQGFYIAHPAPLGSKVEMTQSLRALEGALGQNPESVPGRVSVSPS